MSWQKIWNQAPKQNITLNYSIDDLLELDGFNSHPLSIMDEVSIKSFVKRFLNNVIKPKSTVFEVGCGSTAFLTILKNTLDIKVIGGLDFSKPLIEVARIIHPGATFFNSEAIDIDSYLYCDIQLSFGVFHYFPSLDYSIKVLDNMREFSKVKFLIMDVPNLETKDEFISFKKSKFKGKEFESMYKNLDHLFYDKNFFIQYGGKNKLKVDIIKQNIYNYKNSDFRYNVIFSK